MLTPNSLRRQHIQQNFVTTRVLHMALDRTCLGGGQIWPRAKSALTHTLIMACFWPCVECLNIQPNKQTTSFSPHTAAFLTSPLGSGGKWNMSPKSSVSHLPDGPHGIQSRARCCVITPGFLKKLPTLKQWSRGGRASRETIVSYNCAAHGSMALKSYRRVWRLLVQFPFSKQGVSPSGWIVHFCGIWLEKSVEKEELNWNATFCC